MEQATGTMPLRSRVAATALAAGLVGLGSAAAQTGAGSHGAHAQQGREVASARAEIKGEKVTGEALFVEREHGDGQRVVHITVKIKGDPAVLTPGLHGVHIHEKGACDAPFTSAGGHFDPGPAGNSDPDVNHPFHMGDLPNLRVDQSGAGTLEAMTTRVTLSDGPTSLFDADGSAIIIHGKQDQLTSGPTKSGVSGGPRLACGVITKR
jgi:Cu-Zn family superoxide dismutase